MRFTRSLFHRFGTVVLLFLLLGFIDLLLSTNHSSGQLSPALSVAIDAHQQLNESTAAFTGNHSGSTETQNLEENTSLKSELIPRDSKNATSLSFEPSVSVDDISESLKYDSSIAKSNSVPITQQLVFEFNVGQFAPHVKAQALGAIHGLYLTNQGFTLQLPYLKQNTTKIEQSANPALKLNLQELQSKDDRYSERHITNEMADKEPQLGSKQIQHTNRSLQQTNRRYWDEIEIIAEGANLQPRVEPELPLPSRTHVLFADGRPAVRDIAHHSRIRYHSVYPGIDKLVYGRAGQIEFDWIVHPGADPDSIVQRINRAQQLELQADGSLRIKTTNSQIYLKPPVAYQSDKDGTAQFVQASYELITEDTFRIATGSYDRTRMLVIDPIIEWATYINESAPHTILAPYGEGVEFHGIYWETVALANGHNSSWLIANELWPAPVKLILDNTDDSSSNGLNLSDNQQIPGLVLMQLDSIGFSFHTLIRIPRAIGFDVAIDPNSARPIFMAALSTDSDRWSLQMALFHLNSTYDGFDWIKYLPDFILIDDPLRNMLKIGSDGHFHVLGPTSNEPPPDAQILDSEEGSGEFENYEMCLIQRIEPHSLTILSSGYVNHCRFPTISVGYDPNILYLTYQSLRMPPTFDPIWSDLSTLGDYWGRWVRIYSNGSQLSVIRAGMLPTWARNSAVDSQGYLYTVGPWLIRVDTLNGQAIAWHQLTNVEYYNPPIELRHWWADVADSGPSGREGQQLRESIAIDTLDRIYVTYNSSDGACCRENWVTGHLAKFDTQLNLLWRHDFTGNSNSLGFSNDAVLLDLATVPFPLISNNLYVLAWAPNLPPWLKLADQTSPIDTTMTSMAGTGPGGGGLMVIKLQEKAVLKMIPNRPTALGETINAVLEHSLAPIGEVALSISNIETKVTEQLPSLPLSRSPQNIPLPDLPVGVYSLHVSITGNTEADVSGYYAIHRIKAGHLGTSTILRTDPAVPREGENIKLIAQVSRLGTFDDESILEPLNGSLQFRHEYQTITTQAVSDAQNPMIYELGHRCRYSSADLYSADAHERYYAYYAGDSNHAASLSNPVDIILTPANPQAQLINPTAGNYSIFTPIDLQVNLVDITCYQKISRATFYASPVTHGNSIIIHDFPSGSAQNSYSFKWENLPEGDYDIGFTATLLSGNKAEIVNASPVRITIANGQAGGEVSFLHTDAIGNAVAATDNTGRLIWRKSYEPFGEAASNSGTFVNTDGVYESTRQFYHGKALDSESGLSYFGARYYDNELGRFTGIDPVAWNENNLHSFNRYAFANNNPLRFTDPDGRYVEIAFDIISLGLSIREFYREPTLLNGLGVLADTAGVILPIVPSGFGIIKNAERAAEAAAASKKTVQAAEAAKEVGNGANSATNALKLEKQLASQEQLSQLSKGGGTVISDPAKQADRIAAQTGRNPANIQKVSSDARVARDGQQIQTHSFRDKSTNELIEPKTIIGD